MTIITEKVSVPAREETRDKAIKCDMCGAISPRPDDWSAAGDSFGVSTVTIEREVGTHYPEERSVTTYSVDLCPTCFDTLLAPWLAANGAPLREEDRGW